MSKKNNLLVAASGTGGHIFPALAVSKEVEDELMNSKFVKKKKLENLSKDIEYISTNRNGDIFKIIAKYGKTNIKNNNICSFCWK